MKRTLALLLMLALLTWMGAPAQSLAETETEHAEIGLAGNDTEEISMSDPELLQYIKEEVYADLSEEMDGSDYQIGAVDVVNISKEYLEELDYNSQVNIFFGYTLDELDEQFQGKRYIFTMDDSYQTTVEEFQEVEDDSFADRLVNAIKETGRYVISIVVNDRDGSPVGRMLFILSLIPGTPLSLKSALIPVAKLAYRLIVCHDKPGEALKAMANQALGTYKWCALASVLAP